MQKHTPVDGATIEDWLPVIVEAWRKASQSKQAPSSKEFAQELGARLSIDPAIAVGLLQGIDSLVGYAQSEFIDRENAIDEERRSIKAAMQAVRPILEARLQHRIDQIEANQSNIKCKKCGHVEISQGKRNRGWQSIVGKLSLGRRYYWCYPCKQGEAFSERRVGLPNSDFTAGFEEICSVMAATVPYDFAARLINKLLGIEVSEKGMETLTQRRGELVARLIENEAREINEYMEKWTVPPKIDSNENTSKKMDVAYVEMDGVIVMTRRAIEAQPETGVGRGGKGIKYQIEGREVKNAVLYDGAGCANESDNRGCILEKKYVSHLGDWREFGNLIWAAILKMGFDKARLLVVISDGAQWIRQLCEWLPVDVMLILDLYHVKRRIWEVGGAVYGESTEQAKEWSQQQCSRIEQGQAKEVIESLIFLKKKNRKAMEVIESLEGYLNNNLDRMDYPSYRASGLRVSTAAVESANYHVTGARLKLQGMRWSENGAAQMACLRTDMFNGLWESRTYQILKAS